METEPPDIIVNYDISFDLNLDIQAYIKTILDLTDFSKGTFEFTFVSDSFMIELNLKSFNKDYSTDIITFNLDTRDNPLADIYICIDEARRNAVKYNKLLEDEIKLLIIHGILHIKGYEDYDEPSRKIMFEEQDNLLKKAELS